MSETLLKKIIVTGEIETLSGLSIGGSNATLGIGGIDKEVIRNPIDNKPYIPGSTLKGKLRSLLELNNGNIKSVSTGAVKWGADDNIKNPSTLLCGSSSNSENNIARPSRLIVRDCPLLNPDELQNTELPYTEAKTENVIDRITSKAMPRTFERVPAKAKFGLKLILNIFEGDNEFTNNDVQNVLMKTLWEGLLLVQDDYLGGGGSRGNGNVKISVFKVVVHDLEYYTNEGKLEKDISNNCGLPEALK